MNIMQRLTHHKQQTIPVFIRTPGDQDVERIVHKMYRRSPQDVQMSPGGTDDVHMPQDVQMSPPGCRGCTYNPGCSDVPRGCRGCADVPGCSGEACKQHSVH